MSDNKSAGYAAFAITCSLLLRREKGAHPDALLSELVCWIVLPLLITLKSGKREDGLLPHARAKQAQPGRWRLWVVVLSIAASTLCKAEEDVLGILPMLTPMLLAYRSNGLYFMDNKVMASVLIAVMTVASMLVVKTKPLLFAIAVFAAEAAIAFIFMAWNDRDVDIAPTPSNLELILQSLSWRVVAALAVTFGIQMLAFGPVTANLAPILMDGVIKAALWLSLCGVTSSTTWTITTTISTFATVATISPSTPAYTPAVVLHMLNSGLALLQTIHMLPTTVRHRKKLLLFWLVYLIPLATHEVQLKRSINDIAIDHPIETIIYNARMGFVGLISKQSRTYGAARAEYVRRYNFDPPPGFEDWYKFAVENQSPILDEFDEISKGVSPFWKFSGLEVFQMMRGARESMESDLWRCILDNGILSCNHPQRSYDRHIKYSLRKLLFEHDLHLPRVEFLVNHLDEPSVLLPAESKQRSYAQGGEILHWEDLSHRPAWDTLIENCQISQTPKQSFSPMDIKFVTNITSTYSLCEHPEYATKHGMFFSPTTLRLAKAPVPILSTGTFSTMGDILFPSPAYNETSFKYDETKDMDWNSKHNNLYWSGSTTGGFAVDGNWRHYQRQRLASLAQNLESTPHKYLRFQDGVLKTISSTFLHGRLYDVGLTQMIQCTRKTCREQQAYFQTKSWSSKDQALKSKLVFDLDGNGISGRYYKFLASKSTPLKMTLFREWHDDRLIPWVHYVPVSLGMEELPEIVTYLTSSKLGQKRAKEIGEHGRDWFSKAFRDVDLTIYMYRLMLELARIQDPKREAGKP